MEISSINEKEIIEILTDIINDEASIIDEIDYKAIQGLLDLYEKEKLNNFSLSDKLNKEKEKNKKLEDKIKEILRKDRDCMSLGYYSAYIGLIDDIQELLYEE